MMDAIGRHWSVAKAKKAIASYKKAIGYPEGMAELLEAREIGWGVIDAMSELWYFMLDECEASNDSAGL